MNNICNITLGQDLRLERQTTQNFSRLGTALTLDERRFGVEWYIGKIAFVKVFRSPFESLLIMIDGRFSCKLKLGSTTSCMSDRSAASLGSLKSSPSSTSNLVSLSLSELLSSNVIWDSSKPLKRSCPLPVTKILHFLYLNS